jgi:hypothetical protein
MTVGIAGGIVALVLPAVLGVWATVGWLMSGVFIRSARATTLEWSAFLIFSWGLLIVLCGTCGKVVAVFVEAFARESRRSALNMGLGVVAGALVGAFAAGTLTISLVNGGPGVAEHIAPLYWFWGPACAMVGGLFCGRLARAGGKRTS